MAGVSKLRQEFGRSLAGVSRGIFSRNDAKAGVAGAFYQEFRHERFFFSRELKTVMIIGGLS